MRKLTPAPVKPLALLPIKADQTQASHTTNHTYIVLLL